MNIEKKPTYRFNKSLKNNIALIFLLLFISLFLLFDAANKLMNSVLMNGTQYFNPYISEHFNYIQTLRTILIVCSSSILNVFNYTNIYTDTQILALNGIPCNINYGCLGLGVMSFWTAFIIAFPKPFKAKFKFLILGLFTIFVLNVVRIVALTMLTVDLKENLNYLNYQHDLFNYVIYAILFAMIYFWTKNNKNAAHKNNIAV